MSIWKYENLKKNIKEEYQLSLNEGNTPVEKLMVDGCEVLVKREDKNPNQSFKDRSLCYQIAYYVQQGRKDFVISSSGNAARSAIAYCTLHDVNLTVFVSEKIDDYKFRKLQDSNDKIQVIKSKRPKSDAIKFARENSAVNLRGSVDSNAIIGFKTIAYELLEQESDIDAIFICCSSGTSTVGIHKGFNEAGKKSFFEKFIPFEKCPPLHIVQTSKIHPIAKVLNDEVESTKTCLANAVSDRVAHRKDMVVDVVMDTGGYGWTVGDEELREAKLLVQSWNFEPTATTATTATKPKGIDIEGYNAYVGVAGYLKAVKEGYKFKKPLILITGI